MSKTNKEKEVHKTKNGKTHVGSYAKCRTCFKALGLDKGSFGVVGEKTGGKW